MAEINTIARPYAKALFELALDSNTLKEWSLALTNLALIAGNQELKTVFNNPTISRQWLADLFIKVAGKSINEGGKRLINMLAERKRLNILPAIASRFQQCVAEWEKTIEVKVVSAYPIDSSRLQRLKQSLQNYLKRQVTLHCTTDKTLIGGAIIYAGDKVIDGSIRGKLNRLSERLCVKGN